jgi:hypothetical protein
MKYHKNITLQNHVRINTNTHSLILKLSPCSECCIPSLGWFPRCLNFMCGRFGICCLFLLHRCFKQEEWQSVPKCWHTKFRRQGIPPPTKNKTKHMNIYLDMCNNPDTVVGRVSWELYHENVTIEPILKCWQQKIGIILLMNIYIYI